MPQIIYPPFAAVINNTAGYTALQAPRRNSANTAWEMGVAGWLDQSQTWAAQQVFLTGTSGQTPLVVRQTGGTASVDEVQVWHDGTNGFLKTKTGLLTLSSDSYGDQIIIGDSSRISIGKCLVDSSVVQVFSGGYFGWGASNSAILNTDTALVRASAGRVQISTDGSTSTYGSLAALSYYLGTNVVGGSITATNSASGAGQTLTITGSSAGGLSTNAGGPVRVVPGAGTSGGAAGYFAVMQPGGTPGTTEFQIWNDGTNSYLKSANGSLFLENSGGTAVIVIPPSGYVQVPYGLQTTISGILSAAGVGLWGTTPPASQPAAITAPSGGAIQDAEARTAIAAILAVLSAASSGYGFTA